MTTRAPSTPAAVSDLHAIGRAPATGAVTRVTYTPRATITGQATNTRRVALVNRGQTGSGTGEVAILQFDAGVDAPAFDERALTLGGALDLAEGDVLAWDSDAIGSGLADPGGLVVVEFGTVYS